MDVVEHIGQDVYSEQTAQPGSTTKHLTWKEVWKDAAQVFALSRLAIIALTILSTGVIPLAGAVSKQTFSSRLHGWYHYDAIAFVSIAHQGYSDPTSTAFFPLWPLLIHLLGTPFGGSTDAYYVAGLLLANVCFFFVLVLFHRLISTAFGPSIANTGLLYLAFYPYALFFFAGYSESLFLLLCLGFFLLLQSQRMRYWWLAGLIGLLASLTRSTGIVLALPSLVVALQRYWLGERFQQTSWWQKLHALAPICLVPAGLVLYMVYLTMTKGNPFIFSSSQSQWERSFQMPWVGLYWTLKLFHHGFPSTVNIMDVTFTVVPIAIFALGWKRLPLHYTLFGIGTILFALSFPRLTAEPLFAVPRYLMVIFPIIIICALWSKRPQFDRLYLIISVAVLALNIAFFTSHHIVG